MTTKHTPLPWKLHHNSSTILKPFDAHGIRADNDAQSPIAVLWEGGGTKGKPRQRANAAFIVRACNSHYELLESLQSILPDYELCEIADARHGQSNPLAGIWKKNCKMARAAIKKATS